MYRLLLIAIGAALLQAQTSAPLSSKPQMYEDNEVSITIPAGWTRLKPHQPNTTPQATLLLEKEGFRLQLAFRTSHASGIIGGRFIEAFRIPWLNTDDAWNCSGYLSEIPQPVNEVLLFNNLILDTGQPAIRSACGLPGVLDGRFTVPGVPGEQITSRKWFAGYFATGRRSWFINENAAEGCAMKLYSLTSTAVSPQGLPIPEDPHLKQIIKESIGIVNAIRYKHCEPTPESPFL